MLVIISVCYLKHLKNKGRKKGMIIVIGGGSLGKASIPRIPKTLRVRSFMVMYEL